MPPGRHVLLLVAVRTDSEQVQRRIETILAVASTYETPPNTTASVYARPVTELTATDADHLAYFIGREGLRGLNVGDVVAGSGIGD